MNKPGEPNRISNNDLVVLAVYLLGGSERYVDTEDVAVKVNSMAPGRFAWRKYPSQINLELVRVYLSDAKKKSKGVFLTGDGTRGWMLTGNGIKRASPMADRVEPNSLTRKALLGKDRQRMSRNRAWMVNSPAFRKYVGMEVDSITKRELMDFFKLDDYLSKERWEQKMEEAVDVFGHDRKLGAAVMAIANLLRKEMQHNVEK
jgi:hypothetical protein